MKETKPIFLARKYNSILIAAIIEEMVVYIVSLTDTIVAGNMIGEEAIEVVGLAAPLTTIALFLAAIVNSGTVRNYNYYIGSFDRKRANQFFSQGMLLAIFIGFAAAVIMLLVRGWFVSTNSLSEGMARMLSQYYTIILLYVFLEPSSVLLDNIAIAEGGEKLAAFANIMEITVNVVLSVVLGMKLSVAGIALASVISKVAFILLILIWLFFKKTQIRFQWYWNLRDCLLIVRTGIVRASTFALTAIVSLILNTFTLHQFGNDALVVLSIVQRYLGFSSLFLGISTAIQPLMGTLQGENNTKAERYLMRMAWRIMLSIGIIISFLTVTLAPFLVRILGVKEGDTQRLAVTAVQISCLTLFIQAVLILFFLYYFVTERSGFSLLLSLQKDFIFPVSLAMTISMIIGAPTGLWIGLMLAPVAALLISFLIVLRRGGRKGFPLMLSRERDPDIHIYDFQLTTDNTISMSKTAAELAGENGYSDRIQNLISLYVEDVLLLIQEKNSSSSKKLLVECTLMTEENGLRLILRDSGIIFDLTDADALPNSFRQYIVANMMEDLENKAYLTTTGYNRNEFFFSDAETPTA